MLGSDGVVRLNQSSFPTAESQHEYSRYQDAKTGLEEPTHSNPLHFVRHFNGRNTTHTSNHTEDQSQSTVFTMVNKQFQPSMTTMNTVVKEDNDISNSNSNHDNKYNKLNEESLMKDDTHSHTSQKFKVLQQSMKEELYNSCLLYTSRCV